MDDMLGRIQQQATSQAIRVTQHARQEMAEEQIMLDEVLAAIADGQILEDYSEHQRGACCLLYGHTRQGRPLHIVCTTKQPLLVIITVYVPQPPKWVSSTRRRNT